jgi:serine/threonine protein kinase
LRASKIAIDVGAVHFRNLIEGLLAVKPERRLQICNVLKHPWICTVCPTEKICCDLLKTMCQRLQTKRDAAEKRSMLKKDEEMGFEVSDGGSSASGPAKGGASAVKGSRT